MYKAPSKSRGLSLIETVVYVAIIVIVLLALVSAVVFSAGVLKEIIASKTIKSSAISSLERMTREVRRSEDVNTTSSVFDVHPGKLVLNTTDSAGSPTTIEFYVDDGVIKMDEGGTYIGDLTLSNASTTNLIFRNMSNSVADGVKIEITLENEKENKVENFYTSAVSRGSY